MFRNEFKNVLIAVSLVLSSGPIVFAETPATVTPGDPINDDRRALYLAHQQKLKTIQANRPSIIQDIVNTWASESSINVDQWIKEITFALNKASNADLLKIQDAKSYSEVQGVLLGEPVLRSNQQLLSVSAASDLIAPLSLSGDATSDLVFTPVFPCRIYDSRPSEGGQGSYGNSIRSYQVWGDGVTIGGQGGNPAGCPAPNGEPSAISANFTVVPGGASGGWITVYPYGGTQPYNSLVNYYANTNIANSAIVATAPYHLDGYDISVYHRDNINSLADVMGYFYPAKPAADFYSGYPGPLNGDNNLHSFGYSVKITTTTNNQKVFWTAHQPVGTASAASNLKIWPCWRNSADDPDLSASWTTEGFGSFGITMTGTQRNIVSSSAVVAPGAGDHDFGLCYKTDDTGWNFNEFGYVSAQVNP